jgi:hypothetical protein
MTVDVCVEARNEALRRHGTPEIFNTDQGSQFTSAAFAGALTAAGVRISISSSNSRWVVRGGLDAKTAPQGATIASDLTAQASRSPADARPTSRRAALNMSRNLNEA